MVVRLDLHVHTTFSRDSRLSLEELPTQLGARGLSGAAVTDHNTVRGHSRLRALSERYSHLWFVPGIEVSAR
ncbi:MAG: PHP domain-containing protein, partial [Thermoplasmata archaeon]